MNEKRYNEYIAAFNAACRSSAPDFHAFFDAFYEKHAVFEYIPAARKNKGREIVEFWEEVHAILEEQILPHRSFLSQGNKVAVEAPIDFLCKKDLEWVGVSHKKDDRFRLMMCAFYDITPNDRFEYVRVYSIYHPAYKPGE